MAGSKKNYLRDLGSETVNGTLEFCMSSLSTVLYLILNEITFCIAVQSHDQFMHSDLHCV